MTTHTTTNKARGALAFLLAALILVGTLGVFTEAQAVRLKDIATFGGVRNNQLVGYGLVVGLAGTGDSRKSEFTIQSLVNMLEVMGVAVDKRNLRPKNVAAVMVTVQMPVSSKPGTRLDATVSSLGDAESLLGGVLLMTPLKGIDGKVYGLAQGPLTVGGFSVQGEAASATKNITTGALIPNGATIERGVPFNYNDQELLKIHMNQADFSTTMQVVDKINQTMGGEFARAQDITTIELDVPPRFAGNLVPFMASLENLEVSPDSKAKVVVDEKTGTVVLGRNVRLSKAAVAHGNLQIVIQENLNVSQPGAFAPGQTVVTPETELGVVEEDRRLMMLEGATLQELVDGLNSIGATPRDLISILRTLKSAGALHAELEVI
ncbi:flagellar biosynthesis protein FlgA [Oceanidesulfovibrio indonesiensis]|uniref:Flagellar P-ring protein n=1 Tax=Oceanidesulfovibrio indonesiensis TaxID=54767 RepID=A0A7M3MH56_9BACT|nr:flagellar basal body P-ring protein FlgI [Oceanidesulfovibrio indonesiensis]TVM18827.1 flagellar biosynthesis protein FlgA [Oceanidesulfovibrio indonesiensis]